MSRRRHNWTLPGLRFGGLEVSGGFLLWAAFLYYMDTDGLIFWAGAACVIHELAHWLAIRLWGGEVAAFKLTCTGAEMVLSARRPLNGWGECWAALAGPMSNLLAAVLSARWGGAYDKWYLFAGLNVTLAVFNLLPVAPLDGGRALRGMLGLAARGRPGLDPARIMDIVSLAVSGALALGSGILAWQGRASLTLPLCAGWLLWVSAAGREKKLSFS